MGARSSVLAISRARVDTRERTIGTPFPALYCALEIPPERREAAS
jgi:hypothetical protein